MVKSSATHSVASDVLFAPRSPVVVDWNASSVAVFELFQIALAADHWQRRWVPHLLLNSLQTAKHTHTHTHTLDFTEARDNKWQWHQLGHRAYASLQLTPDR